MISSLIAIGSLLPLSIMIIVYRLGHSGKVCSGDYRYQQIAGDYDPTLA